MRKLVSKRVVLELDSEFGISGCNEPKQMQKQKDCTICSDEHGRLWRVFRQRSLQLQLWFRDECQLKEGALK